MRTGSKAVATFTFCYHPAMINLDTDKIDDAVLAILMLGASGNKAWKGIDAAALDRLHDKGLVGDPYGKTPTIELSAEGLARGRRLVVELFGRTE